MSRYTDTLPPISQAQAFLDGRDQWIYDQVENKPEEIEAERTPRYPGTHERMSWIIPLLMATLFLQ